MLYTLVHVAERLSPIYVNRATRGTCMEAAMKFASQCRMHVTTNCPIYIHHILLILYTLIQKQIDSKVAALEENQEKIQIKKLVGLMCFLLLLF